jgi:hypothetical protein
MYPYLYARKWQVTVVRRWRNFYRTADLVGRKLGAAEVSNPPCAITDVALGSGGHTEYFSDRRLARELC